MPDQPEGESKKVKVEEAVESPIERRRRLWRENAKRRRERKALQIKQEVDTDANDMNMEEEQANPDGETEDDDNKEEASEAMVGINALEEVETSMTKLERKRALKAAWQRRRRAEKKRLAEMVVEVDNNLEVREGGEEQSDIATENIEEDEKLEEDEVDKEAAKEKEEEHSGVEEEEDSIEEENLVDEEPQLVMDMGEEEEDDDEEEEKVGRDVELVDVEEEEAISAKENSIFYQNLVDKENRREDDISDDDNEKVSEAEEEISDNENEPYKNLIDSYLSKEQGEHQNADGNEELESKSVEESIENIQSFLEDGEDSALEVYPEDDDDEVPEEAKDQGVEEEDLGEEEEDQVPEEERVSVSVEAHNDMISVFQKNPVSETAADLLMLKEKHGLVTREINWWFIRVREMTRALDLEEEQLPEFFDKFNQKHTRDGVVSF